AEIEAAAELRGVVEPPVAALAAERAAPEAVERLEALNAEMRAAEGDDYRFMRADSGFHLALARAAGNPLLLEAVERSRLLLARALEALPESPAWHERSVAQHAALLEALRDGDAERARAAMARHVEDTNRALRLMLTALGS
ncbi:MAG: FCD domain-containing protein, partial [Solirubrobacteraceae bacterium]